MIIDDEPKNIFALRAVLRSRGFTVESAASMDEAFSMLDSKGGIGLILLDMMMPGMDGYEAIPALKKRDSSAAIPIFSVTAQAMAGDREKSLAAGADEYIPKPVDVDLLFDLLTKYLK